MPVEQQHARYAWYHKVIGIVYAIFCFEVGIFLLILPWSRYWDYNYFSSLPFWSSMWASDYVRGAVSGLGVINLYVSFQEVFALRRFAGGGHEDEA